MILRLAWSNLTTHRIRVALTVAAIALSVSLVVAVTSGYTSAEAAATRALATYMGSTDAQITLAGATIGGINGGLIQQIENDPDVERVDGRLEIESRVLNDKGEPVPGRSMQIIGIGRPHDVAVDTLRMDKGAWFDTSEGNFAVFDQVAAQRIGTDVGGSFILPGPDRQLKLEVVGRIHKPGLLATWIQTIYVPLHTLQEFTNPGQPRQYTRILVNLRRGVDHDAFVARWRQALPRLNPNLRIRAASDNRKEMDRNLQGLHFLSYLGSTVSTLAATFIVFSALSMGVAERQRTLAMLRAIGALRAQVGRLVVAEGILLAVAGVIVGVPLGVLWINLLAWKFDLVFSAGAVVSLEGIMIAIIGSIVTALAASLLPAFTAMRASPLDSMIPLANPSHARGMRRSAVAGVLLLCIDPLILFTPLDRSFQFYAHFSIGLTSLMIGFFLLAPVTVWIIERTLGPLVAILLGLDFAMLRQQLSGGVWRAAGTCAALMVGLAILVVTQTQGTSVLSAWKLPDQFPDIFIWSGTALNAPQIEKLRGVEGIRRDQVLPIALASPEFGSDWWAIAGAAVMPNATMFFGIDPDLAMSMLELDFREGSPEEAARMLKLGKHVIVTQEYKQLKGLGVGSKVPLKTNKGNMEFTVAGVVWSPGIDVLVGMHDLEKQFDQRTAASLFGSLDDAKEYFGADRIRLFAANLEGGVEKRELVLRIQRALGMQGFDAGDVRQIKHAIETMLGRLLFLVASVAYAALAVASLGVTNTVMASIRSRRWQFGILRSIGLTRSQLLRLVLAEAVLLGIVAVALGLAAGSLMAVDARQEWAVILGFKAPLVVPWRTVGIGVASVMTISILASLWPAAHVARSEPLSLLQAGRAAV